MSFHTFPAPRHFTGVVGKGVRGMLEKSKRTKKPTQRKNNKKVEANTFKWLTV